MILSVISLMATTYSQDRIDFEKEKEAIIAVIEEETNAFYERDFDRLAATYVQDEYNTRLYASKQSVLYTDGWEEYGSMLKNWSQANPEPVKNNEVKKNYRIKVFSDCAYAVFENENYTDEGEFIGNSVGVNFLEKINGEWKIVFVSRVNLTTYQE